MICSVSFYHPLGALLRPILLAAAIFLACLAAAPAGQAKDVIKESGISEQTGKAALKQTADMPQGRTSADVPEAEQENAGEAQPQIYRLGSGDKIRLIIFNEPDMSGPHTIDGQGMISIPLAGGVHIGGQSPREAESTIRDFLSKDYLKNPGVSLDILEHRPFYILGEVRRPGSYNYISGMNVLKAVAISGGFTYRANRRSVEVIRSAPAPAQPVNLSVEDPVEPGDVILIKERFF